MGSTTRASTRSRNTSSPRASNPRSAYTPANTEKQHPRIGAQHPPAPARRGLGRAPPSTSTSNRVAGAAGGRSRQPWHGLDLDIQDLLGRVDHQLLSPRPQHPSSASGMRRPHMLDDLLAALDIVHDLHRSGPEPVRTCLMKTTPRPRTPTLVRENAPNPDHHRRSAHFHPTTPQHLSQLRWEAAMASAENTIAPTTMLAITSTRVNPSSELAALPSPAWPSTPATDAVSAMLLESTLVKVALTLPHHCCGMPQ